MTAFPTPLYLHEVVLSEQRESGDVTALHFAESVPWAKPVSTVCDYEDDCTVFIFIKSFNRVPQFFL